LDTAVLLVAEAVAELELELHHPVITPHDPQGWMLDLLGGALVAADEMTTTLGWPFILAHGVLLDADGTVREHRLGGFYRFFHFTAAFVARAADPEALAERRASLVEIARSARPDFRDEHAVALSDLWSDSLPLLN
jgi:hypothetical protein